jgi:hypothetical protein
MNNSNHKTTDAEVVDPDVASGRHADAGASVRLSQRWPKMGKLFSNTSKGQVYWLVGAVVGALVALLYRGGSPEKMGKGFMAIVVIAILLLAALQIRGYVRDRRLINIKGTATHISWADTSKFWWSFTWRATIYGAVFSFFLGFTLSIVLQALGYPDPDKQAFGSLVGFVGFLPASLLAMKQTLTARLALLM